MINKTPLIINGWNIDPNNIKEMPSQILDLAIEEHNYYELSKGEVIEKWAIEEKIGYAKTNNPLWHREIELIEGVFNKRDKPSYTQCLPGIARKLRDEEYDKNKDYTKGIKEIFEIEEGKLYGFEEYTSLVERDKKAYSQGFSRLIDDVRVREDWFNNFNVKGKPLFIFKAEKVEDYVLYRGYKCKLITLHKVNEQEFNELFW